MRACLWVQSYNQWCVVEASGQDNNNMLLTPGETSCFSFNFVAKTQDVGKKIEVRPGAVSTGWLAVGLEKVKGHVSVKPVGLGATSTDMTALKQCQETKDPETFIIDLLHWCETNTNTSEYRLV